MMLFNIFLMFLKIGAVGFGGGYAMLSMIFAEGSTIGLTNEVFSQLLALDLVVPGPIALNASTFIGYIYGDIFGAVVGTIAVILPSIFYVEIIFRFLKKFQDNKYVQGLLNGIIPATIVLILYAAYQIGYEGIVIDGIISIQGVVIFAVSLFSIIKMKIDPVVVTIAAGVVGVMLSLV